MIVAGDSPTHLLHHNQDVDQSAVCSAVGAGVQRLRAPETIVADLARACFRAMAERRPIVMSVPTNLQVRSCPTDGLRALVWPQRQAVRPADAAIGRLADLVQTAERPVIIAGRGCVHSGARDPLVRLADRIGALLATTAQARGLFSGHPYFVGASGVFSSTLGARLLGEADLVLAFGASLNPFTTRNRELYSPTARLVQVDHRDSALGALTPVDLGVLGDAAATAEALLDELARRGYTSGGFHSEALRQEIASFRPDPGPVGQAPQGTIDPRTLMVALEELLPRERAVVADSGHSMGWPATYLSVPDATAYVFANDFMVVGLGLSMAAGAAIARPDRVTVVVVGDGGFLMSLGELDTVVRYQVPLLIVVMNDAAYGVEVHLLARAGKPLEPALFRDQDFAALARAAGASGATVRTVADLDVVRTWLAERRGPLVLDCKLDPLLRADWFEQMTAPGSWYTRMMAH